MSNPNPVTPLDSRRNPFGVEQAKHPAGRGREISPTQTRSDRGHYLALTRKAAGLRVEAAGMHAVSRNVLITPDPDEFDRRRADIMRKAYEQAGTELAALAAEVQEQADSYFALLTGEQS